MKDNIYCAVCGSAYPKVLQYWLKKGFLSNLIVNIYSDSDKDIYFYKKLIDEYSIWVKEFHVFYNRIYDSKGKSDYGVPKEMIDVKEDDKMKKQGKTHTPTRGIKSKLLKIAAEYEGVETDFKKFKK